MTDSRQPERFHPSEYIREEMEARGWTIDDLAARMPDATAKLALDMYLSIGADNPEMLLGEYGEWLALAFGVSPGFFHRLHETWLAHVAIELKASHQLLSSKLAQVERERDELAARTGCLCDCCDHSDGDCACDCHSDGLCSSFDVQAALERLAQVEQERDALKVRIEQILGPRCPCKCGGEPWHQWGICKEGEDMIVTKAKP